MGIHNFDIHETPFAVIDTETTGLAPGDHRIVELSVVRVDPGRSPRLVLDTLINPRRPVEASEIHGIYDEHVATAPTFVDVWPTLAHSLSGCVVAAYNAYFDMKFLAAELQRTNEQWHVPFVCLMYMRPLLGLGRRCSLADACNHHGVSFNETHRSSEDALGAAMLLQKYLGEMELMQIRRFEELAHRGDYQFFNSFNATPLMMMNNIPVCRLLPREDVLFETPSPPPPPQIPIPAIARSFPIRAMPTIETAPQVTAPKLSLTQKFRRWLSR